ncbi:MAG: hypothetical protein AB8B50_01820 [Pirellulaceae bacterium]
MNLQRTFQLPIIGLCSLFAIGSAQAQVVQQPVVRNFSYTGSAWVPDSGTGFLAGNRSARSGSTSRGIGPYAPRAIGSSRIGSRVSVSTTIIDLDALDEALLNQRTSNASAGAGGGGTNDPAASASSSSANKPRLAGLSRKIVTTTGPLAGSKSVQTRDANAYLRALKGHSAGLRPAATQSQLEEDVRFYLTQGQKAEKAGSLIAARVFYRMAMESMTPEMLARYQRVLEERKQKIAERKNASQPKAVSF